jgi:hypothetical protein
MTTDTFCTPVVAAAGFAETDLTDDHHVFMAVRLLMHDQTLSDLAKTIAEALDFDARKDHADSEPPLSEGMPDEAFVAWCDWYEKATAGAKPYESLIMALQMLKPKEKAALRERVLAKLKASAVVA